jgi:hypothetical protein
MQEDQIVQGQHEVQEQHKILEEQQQLDVGMALFNLPDADPVWVERSKTAEATRLWVNYFAKDNSESLHVPIPSQWANFFNVMLLSPDIYCWAKDFFNIPNLSTSEKQ